MGLLVLFGVHQAVEPQELRFGVRSDPCHGAQLRVLRTGKDSEQLLLDCVLCIYIYISQTLHVWYIYLHWGGSHINMESLGGLIFSRSSNHLKRAKAPGSNPKNTPDYTTSTSCTQSKGASPPLELSTASTELERRLSLRQSDKVRRLEHDKCFIF